MKQDGDRCINCEFGKGDIELCECPVCHLAAVLGNVRTRNIYCPNGCTPLPFAVDFCAKKNCDSDVYENGIRYKKYRITVSGSLKPEQIKTLSRYFKESTAHIFLAFKQKQSISNEMNIFDIKKLVEYLEQWDAEYAIDPEIAMISRFWECW